MTRNALHALVWYISAGSVIAAGLSLVWWAGRRPTYPNRSPRHG